MRILTGLQPSGSEVVTILEICFFSVAASAKISIVLP